MKRRCPAGVSTVLILGVIAILVTVIIPLLSRSIVDVRISKQQEEQARAFSVAETGLEKVLIGEVVPGGSYTLDNIEYSVSEADAAKFPTSFIYPKPVERDFPITIWLVAHAGADFDPNAALDPSTRYQNSDIKLYWAEQGDSAEPAIEATLFYEEGGNYKVKRYAYDPNNQVGFDSAQTAGSLEDVSFKYLAEIDDLPCTGANICYALRLKLLYGGEGQTYPLGVEATSDLPRQGECYESAATVQTSGITSRVERCIFYKDFPSPFDFVLYSATNLEKTSL